MFWNILNYVIHGIIVIILVFCCFAKCKDLAGGETTRLSLVKSTASFSYAAATVLGAMGLVGLVLRVSDAYQLNFLELKTCPA